MTTLRRFIFAFVFVLLSQIVPASAAVLPSAAAQSSPATYSFTVSHIEGDVMARFNGTRLNGSKLNGSQASQYSVGPRWGYRRGYWVRRFTDDEAIPQFCGNPNNAPLCPTGDLTSGDFTDGFVAVREGDTLSVGDEIYTDDESGVVLTIGSATGGAGSGKLVLAQHSALNIETPDVTADVPDIHLRLDAGLLATMPGSTLPPETTFEIALPDEDATNSEPPSGSELKIWGPARILPIRLDKLPAVMVGHDPESGDVMISVLDGTATLIDGDNQIEIPPGTYTVKQKIQDKEGIPPDAPRTMTDQDFQVWVSALRFGDSDPEPFPILAPHRTDSEPEPFPVYLLVHDQGSDTSSGEHHLLFAPTHTSGTDHVAEDAHTHEDGTHTTTDHAAETDHTSPADHHDATDASHTTDSGHTDTASHDSGSLDTGSQIDSGSSDHVEPTEQPHG